MANNPFDPPIVQVKKTMDRGGITSYNRGFGSTRMQGTSSRPAPDSAPPQWYPENLSDLGDVDLDTDPPEHGETLVWNALLGTWVPGAASGGGGGGQVVGLWENDKTVVFTPPGWVETHLPSAPLAVPTSKPSVAQIVLTDPALVVSSDDGDPEPIGYSKSVVINLSVSHAGGSGGTMYVESSRNGAVVWSNSDGGHASNERGSSTAVFRDCAPGDVLEVRVWMSSAGSVLDWWAWDSFPSHIFRSMPPDGVNRWLYRNVDVLQTSGVYVPTTVLTNPASPWGTHGWSGYRTYHEGSYASTTVSSYPLWLPDSANGLIRSRGYDQEGILIVNDNTTAQVMIGDTPLTVKFDRLKIPSPPP